MSALSRLMTSRAQIAADPAGVEDVQDPLIDIDDQLWFVSNEHVVNNFKGAPATQMMVGLLPPFPIEPPDDLPQVGPEIELEYHHPYTRPGVGIDDIEPLIPEGEVGWW